MLFRSLMNLRLARPTHLVDLNALSELGSMRSDGDSVVIGALVRHSEVEHSAFLAEKLPLLPEVAAHIGYQAVRHRGTVGGSIAHADALAEWPCVALALDADITLARSGGSRAVAADDFFTSMFTTTRQPDELVTSVSFSTRFDVWGFHEFSKRVGDFALIAATVVLRTQDGLITEAHIAVGGAQDRPVRAREAEQLCVGQSIGGAFAEEAGKVAAAGVDPLGDIHGTAAFRRRLVHTEVARALEDATRRATSGEGG